MQTIHHDHEQNSVESKIISKNFYYNCTSCLSLTVHTTNKSVLYDFQGLHVFMNIKFLKAKLSLSFIIKIIHIESKLHYYTQLLNVVVSKIIV